MLGDRVLLINPPLINGVAFTRQGRCQEREEVLGTTKPPYSLVVIAALLREQGIDFRLIDQTAERLSTERAHRAAGRRRLRADAASSSAARRRRWMPTSAEMRSS